MIPDNDVSSMKKTLASLIDTIDFSKGKEKKHAPNYDSQSISSSSSIDVKQGGKAWSAQEEQRFEKLLNQYGTDFTILSSYFPSKSKNQLKRKYSQIVERNAMNPKKIPNT